MSTPIRLIVGLGNPGPEYETTRHNAGFWLADHVADDLRASFSMEKGFSGFVAKGRHGGDNVVLLKPMTYMNRSGQAVGAVARFFKFTPEQVLVLHDELDLMPGEVKLKQGGGHAGHNGLRDIQAVLGSPNFWRLRLGIGHPRTLGLAQQVADFVLHPPRREEMTGIEKVIDRCRAVMPLLLDGDFTKATQQLHRENKA
ncbi:aminoacyl-tRNA hydrolase [Bordetella sp. N]|uniref:aminoacyl-tRNA hydrolase n=1 Tax=Bordetella sp. N TaxID=1746199 RepID=UPI000708CC15|nr:aminoacyl-tRNA hydrolase [Bordetella sp. N]ALM85889.1 peptidyl-tRNA hydrolase [Bordetella sp. N]